jgi:hypothetical protein
MKIKELEDFTIQVRRDILRQVHKNKQGFMILLAMRLLAFSLG